MLKNIFLILLTVVLVAVAIIFLPLDRTNWGRISILPAATITVTGSATSNVANTEASFGASISATNANKVSATNAVNAKMSSLIASLKNFGIADADIKTETVSVYQLPSSPAPVPMMQGQGTSGAQTLIYPAPPVRGDNGGDWQATNSITITLRDITKASSLSDLLNNSGATNIYGPNLSTGTDNKATDADLLTKAVADAKSKAETIAKAGGQTVGKMINVQESGSNYPVPMMYNAKDLSVSSGSPIQPGTNSLSKSVTVVFELK